MPSDALIRGRKIALRDELGSFRCWRRCIDNLADAPAGTRTKAASLQSCAAGSRPYREAALLVVVALFDGVRRPPLPRQVRRRRGGTARGPYPRRPVLLRAPGGRRAVDDLDGLNPPTARRSGRRAAACCETVWPETRVCHQPPTSYTSDRLRPRPALVRRSRRPS